MLLISSLNIWLLLVLNDICVCVCVSLERKIILYKYLESVHGEYMHRFTVMVVNLYIQVTFRLWISYRFDGLLDSVALGPKLQFM